MEAQILEVQELELRPAIFFSDRIQAPIGRLIHFSNLQKWGTNLVMPGRSSLPRADCVNLSAMPGIHVLASYKDADGRDEPGQDGKQIMPLQNWNPP